MTPAAYINIPSTLITRPRRARLPSQDDDEYSDYSPQWAGMKRAVDLSAQPDGSYAADPARASMPSPQAAELPAATPDRTGIQRYWPTMRAATGEAQESALVQPGEAWKQYEQVAANKPEARKGFVGWLAGMGKGLAYGGVGGAVLGGISPQTIRDYEWQQRDIPRAYQRAQIERVGQDKQLEAGHKVAALTGVDPWTQQPTEQARERQQRQDSTDEYRQQGMFERARAIENRGQEFRETAAKNHVQIAQASGTPVDPKVVAGTTMEPFAGKVLPRAGKSGGAHVMLNGVPYQRNEDTGELEPIPIKGGMPPRATGGLTENEGLVQKRWEAGQSDKTVQRAQSIADKFEKDKSDAHTFYNEKVVPVEQELARREAQIKRGEPLLDAKGAEITDSAGYMTALREKARALKADAQQRLNQARAKGKQHPGYVDDEGGGRIDYEKALPARSGNQSAPAPHAVVLNLYQQYVKAHPEQHEAARRKFIRQRGIDPEAQ